MDVSDFHPGLQTMELSGILGIQLPMSTRENDLNQEFRRETLTPESNRDLVSRVCKYHRTKTTR